MCCPTGFISLMSLLYAAEILLKISAAPAVRRPAEYPRWVAEQLFSARECARLKQWASAKLRFQAAGIGSGSVQEARPSPQSRRARYAALPKQHIALKKVYERLWQAANASNERLWRFAIAPSAMEFIQYSIYVEEEQGHYDWHEDVGLRSATAARVLSASVQLSDGSDYEGGDLLFRWGGNVEVAPRDAGTAVFFPSHVSHRVVPVLKGERHSLVVWFQMDAPAIDENIGLQSDNNSLAGAALAHSSSSPSGRPCPPISVSMPDGQRFELQWDPAVASMEEAARAFVRAHAIPQRHEALAVKQIVNKIAEHCDP